MNFKMIKKAWIVWHDGMLGYPPELYQDVSEIEHVYAQTASKAKAAAQLPYEYELHGSYPEYTDLKVRRAPFADKVELDGVIITRSRAESRMRERKRIKHRTKAVEAMPETELFYIQNGYVGNCVLFWGKGGSGYTADLLQAQEYTKKEVLQQFVGGRDNDIIWPASHIKENTKTMVDAQYLDRAVSI